MTLVDGGYVRSTADEVEVGGAREVFRARRVVWTLVPERDVLKRAVPVLIQSVRPGNASSGQFVGGFVEASANSLPGQEPTVLLCV